MLSQIDDRTGLSANDHSNIRIVALCLVEPPLSVRGFGACFEFAEVSGKSTPAAASRTRVASRAARATVGSLRTMAAAIAPSISSMTCIAKLSG